MTSKMRILLGCACGALAALMIAFYAKGVRADAGKERAWALERYGGEVVEVCVTTQSVLAGEEFTKENVAQASWLVDLVPEGVIEDPALVYGKQATAAKAKNVPLVEGDMLERAVVTVPEGLVAVSVPSADVRAVGGSIYPGCMVDMYATGDGTHLLTQDVLVLATNAAPANKPVNTDAKVTWITLALKPELVESVISAAAAQNLYFVLPHQEGSKGSQVPASVASGLSVDAGAGVKNEPPASEAVVPTMQRESQSEDANDVEAVAAPVGEHHE